MDIEKAINNSPTPNKPITSISEQIKEMDKLYTSMELGSASETVILAIDPIIERRLGMLLDKLSQAPAELGALLDVRAQICETWRIRKALKDAAQSGRKAVDTLKSIFTV